MSRWQTVFALAIWIAMSAGPGHAHAPGLSATRVRVSPTSIESSTTFHRTDAPDWAQDALPLKLQIDGRPVLPHRHEKEIGESHTRVRLEYAATLEGRLRVQVEALGALPIGHKHALRIEDAEGALLADGIIGRDRPFLEVTLGEGRFGAMRVMRGWFLEGVEHITGGWDHLVFLLALVIACPALPRVVRVVTGFTAGHSVSLAAATFGWFSAPPELVEPAIAASILVLAILNLSGRARAAESLGVAFGFGLVHGLGFAGFLAGLGVGGSAAPALPLLAFNLGVEAGQLALLTLALPVLAWLAQTRWVGPRLVPVGSLAIALLSGFWLWERTTGAF